jgi:hypothetical protein
MPHILHRVELSGGRNDLFQPIFSRRGVASSTQTKVSSNDLSSIDRHLGRFVAARQALRKFCDAMAVVHISKVALADQPARSSIAGSLESHGDRRCPHLTFAW